MRGPLQEMLSGRGLRLEDWKHLRSHHRPQGAVSALYRVRCRPRTATIPGTSSPRGSSSTAPAAAAAPAAGAAADSLTLYVGVTTAGAPAAPGLVPARIAGLALGMWLHPHDPVLASLPWATDGEAVGRDVFGSAAAARLSLLAYRPLRRAVVSAEHADGSAYLKLLPKDTLPGLRYRHELLAGAGVPAPPLLPSLGGRDVAVLGALPGTSLFRRIAEDGAPDIAPERLLQLLDSLPAQALELPHRKAWADRAGDYAAAAAAVLPAEAHRIHSLAAGIAHVLASVPAGPQVPVHGDFHEGNLLVTGAEITGLLDIDGLGPGQRADDLACLLGHLAVLAAAHPHQPHFARALQRYRGVFQEAVDPAALNARTAGVVLTLVAGARPVKQSSSSHQARLRLEVAEGLLRAAG